VVAVVVAAVAEPPVVELLLSQPAGERTGEFQIKLVKNG